MRILTLDFETEAIIDGSPKSPKPVGIAVKPHNLPAVYFAWGHPIENNTDIYAAATTVDNLICHHDRVLFHNAKFDLRVLDEHLNIQIDASIVLDSMILAYLHDPREKTFALKYLAEKYCDMAPDAQSELHEWIAANVKGATDKNAGKFICKAPGNLVGKYAADDVNMTLALYNKLKYCLELESTDD